jgi:fructose-1,6-bisphosphatase/inositol monophosphatase family enzyme
MVVVLNFDVIGESKAVDTDSVEDHNHLANRYRILWRVRSKKSIVLNIANVVAGRRTVWSSADLRTLLLQGLCAASKRPQLH